MMAGEPPEVLKSFMTKLLPAAIPMPHRMVRIPDLIFYVSINLFVHIDTADYRSNVHSPLQINTRLFLLLIRRFGSFSGMT